MNIKLKIPESFFQGEERCGYYVTPLMKRVWAVELDLLNEFARVCDAHNIRWFIDAGTLLGAVRHKGFIPWDDDVDVMLLRKDYEKLLTLTSEFQYPYALLLDANSCLAKSPMIRLDNESTTMFNIRLANFTKAHRNVQFNGGIFLDIFPVDDVPDNEEVFMSFYRRTRKYAMRYNWLYIFGEYVFPSTILWKKVIKKSFYYAMSFLKKLGMSPYEYYYRKFEAEVRSSIYPDSKRVSKLVQIRDQKFLERRIWNRSDFDDVIYMPFEMLNLPAPSGWKNILDTFYGDWSKFEIRAPHACFYDTEHSYTYYTKEGHPFEISQTL